MERHFNQDFAEDTCNDSLFDDSLLEAMMAETLASVPDYSSLAEAGFSAKPLTQGVKPAGPLKQLPPALQDVTTHFSTHLAEVFQRTLKEPSRIRFTQHAVLPFEQLELLAPERSYFTLLRLDGPESMWLFHLSREVAEGLASALYLERQKPQRRQAAHPRLSEADSLIYVETGSVLRHCIQGLVSAWKGSSRLGLKGFRHQLTPGVARGFSPQEPYLVQHFSVENRLFQGEAHTALPLRIAHVLLDR